MPYTPAQVATQPEVLISVASERYGVGSDLRVGGGLYAMTAQFWQTNNDAMYMPLYLDRPGTVTKFWTFNGTFAAGNIDIGLYDSALNRLSSAGSTAMAGTSIIQEYDVADFAVTAGQYYLGLVASTTGAAFFTHAASLAGALRAMGLTRQASALPLPNPMVPVAFTAIWVPSCGIAFRTLVA